MVNTSEKEHKMEEKESSCLRGFDWMSRKLNLIEEGATPPNWKYILLIFACLFCSSSSLTFLFPFLPEMILHLGYSENEKGTYGGMIAGSVFAGRIFGSFFWGWLCDKKGRKLVLLCTIILTGLSAGAFGFAVSIPVAMFLRFLCGLFNGIVGTAKTALYDVSDDTNQAIGMTFLSLSWGAGMVAGPFVGGMLASPCSKWPEFCSEESLFGQFPFLLPSLFPCIVSFFGFLLIFFKFDETFVTSQKSKKFSVTAEEEEEKEEKNIDPGTPIKNSHPGHHFLVRRALSENADNELHTSTHVLSRSVVSLNPEAEMSICLGKEVLGRQESVEKSRAAHQKTSSEPEMLFKCDQQLDKGDFDSILLRTFSKSTSHIHHANGTRAPIYRQNGTNHDLDDRTVVSQPEVILSVEEVTSDPLLHDTYKPQDEEICQCCDSWCNLRCCRLCTGSSIHNLLRLSDVWATIMLYTVMSFVTIGVDDIFPVFASTKTDYGGLGFTTDEIGMALGFVTLPLLFIQIKLYPFFVSKMSIRKTYMVMVTVCMVSAQCVPMLQIFNNSRVTQWVLMALLQIPFKLAANCCFASTAILINNSGPQELTGQVNGLAMSTTAVGRTIAPMVAGSLFSWTVTYGQFIGPPFDTAFTFFVMGSIYGVTLIECMFLNPRLDKQKK